MEKISAYRNSIFQPVIVLGLLLGFGLGSVSAQDGFCMVNGTTTGGAGGTVVTVSNGTDFVTEINKNGPRIIQVQGVLSIGRCFTKSDKTIIGLGTNATLLGNMNISDTENVIVQNLRITAPAHDGLTIWNSNHVWVDHCTFYDTGDGLCDMNRGSQYVTISWCKFHYVNQQEHRFTMIADGYNSSTLTLGWYTLHHNWWSTGCDQRMASSSYGRLHYYNNYFNCPGNYYASLARADTQILSENNYYLNVRNPLYSNDTSDPTILIESVGNLYPGCFDKISSGTDSVFAPSYSYTLDAAADVPSIVMIGAGAPGPDTVPIPPKIWDGGGTDNNLASANNWSLNESPKVDDILVFSGSSRLTPNNNLSSGTEFSGLVFSNNAGAFVLGGNAFNLGGTITADSDAEQTINANMDFSYGQDHYTPNRTINVNSSTGSLVINSVISGVSNKYFDSYFVIKQGPGKLTLNGENTFEAALQLNDGMIQFNTINSLGRSDVININGGGLLWAPDNTADISGTPVTFQSGGATLDSGANNIIFASPIGSGGSGGLTKSGSGSITLNGNNIYSGNTLVSEGTLALGLAGTISGTPQIVLTNNAVLDVSGRSDSTLTLGNGQSLAGNGSVQGSVTIGSGAAVLPGLSVGALVVNDALTVQSGGTVSMELDTSLPGGNDSFSGMDSVSYGGSLVVSNLGPALEDGDTFMLFDSGSYGGAFDTIVLPALSGDLVWTNTLAVDGTLAVVLPAPPVNTTPTNLVFSLNGTGTNRLLSFYWPESHIGWTLEAQTNSLGNLWFPVPGSSLTNEISIPFYPDAERAYFRMRYP